MAVHNRISLYGMVEYEPTIVKVGGIYKKAIGYLSVVRAERDTGEKAKEGVKNYRRTMLPILTYDDKHVKTIDNWKVNDIVSIKGVLVTTDTVKVRGCDTCDYIHEKENGVATYITPIAMNIEHTGLSREEAVKILNEHAEVSNEVLLLGTVCSAPVHAPKHEYDDCIKFPLAINRKFVVEDDHPGVFTDYPWVHTFGKNLKYTSHIGVGSRVFIDGSLRMRTYPPRDIPCPNPMCTGTIRWRDFTIDVIPYDIEITSGFIGTKEEKDQMDDDMDDRRLEEILLAEGYEENVKEAVKKVKDKKKAEKKGKNK